MTIYLEAALSYAARGWHVFPTRITKAPFTPHGVKDASADPEQIKRWWAENPNAGVGLACGAVSGLWALDIDPDKGGDLSLEDLEAEHGALPNTLWTKTGGGGRHLIFKVPSGVKIRNSVSTIGAGLDCRGDGGYIILPPSLHDSGGRYEMTADESLVPELAPEWLVNTVSSSAGAGGSRGGSAENDQALPANVRNPKVYVRAALAAASSEIQNAPSGTSNDLLNRKAFSFQRFVNAGWCTRQAVEDALFQAAEARGTNPATTIRKTIASGLGTCREPAEAAPPTALMERSGEPAEPPATGAIVLPSSAPLRLAESFLKTRRDVNGRLMLRHWRDDWWTYTDGHYESVPIKTLRAHVYNHLDRVFTPDKNRDPKKLDPKMTTVANVVDAMMACGTLVPDKIEPPAHLSDDRAFRDLDTAVISNGMLDLASGQVRSLSPDLFATSSLGVTWPSAAPYPPPPSEWLHFLYDVWGDDDASVKLLQQWFGYCLTPDTSHQKMLWFLGPPRSGKGTIVHVLEAILGVENVVHPRLTDLSGPFGLQSWIEKPLVVIGDARLGGRADQDTIVETLLSVSGEDRLTVQRKGLQSITCRLPARLLLLSNLMPRLSDSSGALTSRVLLLRTKKSNLGKERLDLLDALLSELPGILGWAMEGWRSLRADGRFTQPEASRQHLKDFGSFASPVTAFVEDCCSLRDGAEISQAALYERWRRWCADNGNEPGSRLNMSRNLVGAFSGVTAHGRDRGRSAFFSGIDLDDAG